MTVFRDFVKLQRGFDLTKKNMTYGPYPVVGSTSVIGHHNEYKIEPPGVVMGRSGSLGTIQFIRSRYWPHNTALWVKDFKGNDPRFVYYCLCAFDFAKFNAGAGVPTLNRNHLDTLEVWVPPIGTQKKIAGVLAAYDDLIENNTRRIAILEEMIQAIYREWFVNFRFPGHENVNSVDSTLGQIPEGWEAQSLNNVVDFHIGGGWGKEHEEGDHLNRGAVIRGTDIPQSRYMDVSGCPVRFHKESNIRSRRLQDKDIVFEVSGGSKDQSVGRAVLVSSRLLGCFEDYVICASFCKLIRPCQDRIVSSLFFAYLTDSYSNGVIGQYEVQSTGIKNFKFASFLDREYIVLPPSNIQEQFDSQFQALQSQIEVLGKKKSNLRVTRNLLLQKLISGKLDVENLDIDVSEALEGAAA